MNLLLLMYFWKKMQEITEEIELFYIFQYF